MFEYLVPSWWHCFSRLRGCGLAGRSMGAGSEVSKPYFTSSFLCLPASCLPFKMWALTLLLQPRFIYSAIVDAYLSIIISSFYRLPWSWCFIREWQTYLPQRSVWGKKRVEAPEYENLRLISGLYMCVPIPPTHIHPPVHTRLSHTHTAHTWKTSKIVLPHSSK